MPTFHDSAVVEAPLEEVWKLVHDPARFPSWWQGVERTESTPQDSRDGATYTVWPDGYPDFPMPQRLTSSSAEGRVTISCLVSDLEFTWRLVPMGEATRVEVSVLIPEQEAARLETQQAVIAASLHQLSRVAARL